MNLLFHILFFVFSLYILLKSIFYGVYEFKTLNNIVGGIAVISFSILVIVFSNIILIIR